MTSGLKSGPERELYLLRIGIPNFRYFEIFLKSLMVSIDWKVLFKIFIEKDVALLKEEAEEEDVAEEEEEREVYDHEKENLKKKKKEKYII